MALRTFPPGPFTRATVFLTQFGFSAIFISLYVTSPATAHRLVGYIEEMAVVTYTNLIEMMEIAIFSDCNLQPPSP